MDDILAAEHALLGSVAAPEGQVPHVQSYGLGPGERVAHREGVALVDLSGMSAHLMNGAASPSFVSAAFAGPHLSVGECAFEAVLLGDGSIASVALLARSGDAEYVCWDLSARADVLAGWLSFLSSVEQGGVSPFAGVTLEDVEKHLVPLLLWGPQAPAVLADYLGSQTLPGRGSVAHLMLDRIGCLVVTPDLGDTPAYLVLVPPRVARVLWRSFLSFPVVTPMGRTAFMEGLEDALPWFAEVAEVQDKLAISSKKLSEWGLVRDDGTFVGARGLASA